MEKKRRVDNGRMRQCAGAGARKYYDLTDVRVCVCVRVCACVCYNNLKMK